MTNLSLGEVGKVAQYLSKKTGREDMKTIVFDLDMSYDNFPGSQHTAKVREIVAWALRREKLDQLFQACVNQNASIDFSQFNLNYTPEPKADTNSSNLFTVADTKTAERQRILSSLAKMEKKSLFVALAFLVENV